jgi:DNA-binding response OmpR family regulator
MMLYTDAILAKQLSPHLQRVLVVDGAPASARLISDLLKGLGAGRVCVEATVNEAVGVCKLVEPQLIVTELTGPKLNGLEFVRGLRRSHLTCRQAPVIVVTAEATASSIIASRNAGVHEFLRRPFTMRDLMRRLEAAVLRPRDWVEAVNYVGPDRRRFNSGDYEGPLKRRVDHPLATDAARVRQALNILKTAIAAIERDPMQALRSMQAQAAALHATSVAVADLKLTAAVAVLRRCLADAAKSGALSRADIEASAAGLWAFMPDEAVESALPRAVA